MEGWYSFIDHPAFDTLKLFTLLLDCATTFWPMFCAFCVFPASRLLALHLCHVDRGGVRWTTTVMAAVFPYIEMDALLIRLLLGACPPPPRSCPTCRSAEPAFLVRRAVGFATPEPCSVCFLQISMRCQYCWASWTQFVSVFFVTIWELSVVSSHVF